VSGFTALVLAGVRPGCDPVAAYAEVQHKGLIRLEGRSLLQRVLGALEAAGASRILVSPVATLSRRRSEALACRFRSSASPPRKARA